MFKRHLAESDGGLIHIRTLRYRETHDARPLVLLHPMPYSGLYFTTIMPLLDNQRTIIAPDYPGCGSDAGEQTPTIRSYATAILQALDDLGIDEECDFLGFHTGSLVATDIAVSEPDRVSSCILIDIPFFDEKKAKSISASLSSHKMITDELSCLQNHWDTDVKARLDIMPIERAFEIFTDHINSHGDAADGFRAAFSYPAAEKFKMINKPTFIIATKSGLYDGTVAAADLIADSVLHEQLSITRAAFEEGAVQLADSVNHWLTSANRN